MSRLTYVRYDEQSVEECRKYTYDFQTLETEIEKLAEGRYKSLALTALEEGMLWVHKALRDQQLKRTRTAPDHNS